MLPDPNLGDCSLLWCGEEGTEVSITTAMNHYDLKSVNINN